MDRIDRAFALGMRMAFAHQVSQAIAEYTRPDGWSRRIALERACIADTSHEAVLAGIREMLGRNRIIKHERPGSEFARAHEWWLCGALIAEGRLPRATAGTAGRFASNAELAAKRQPRRRSGPDVDGGQGTDDDRLKDGKDDGPAVQCLERRFSLRERLR